MERLDLPVAVAVGHEEQRAGDGDLRRGAVAVGGLSLEREFGGCPGQSEGPSLVAAFPLNVNSAAARVTARFPSISAVTLTVLPFLLGVNVSNWSGALLPSVSVSTFGSTWLFASSVKKSWIEPASPQPSGFT